MKFIQMFSFFLPDWRYNHTGKHRSGILYLCWSWLVNDFVFNVQPASRCTARTSWPHVIFFNLNRECMTGCTILVQISKWDFLCKTATKAPFLLLCSGGPGLRVSSWAPSAAWFEYCTDVHVPQGRVWKCPLTSAGIFQLPCEISQHALDGLSVHTSWLTGWVMLALVSLRGWNIKCQEKNES